MKFHASHLSYCTNIHPAETWAETFAVLRTHVVAVRDLAVRPHRRRCVPRVDPQLARRGHRHVVRRRLDRDSRLTAHSHDVRRRRHGR